MRREDGDGARLVGSCEISVDMPISKSASCSYVADWGEPWLRACGRDERGGGGGCGGMLVVFPVVVPLLDSEWSSVPCKMVVTHDLWELTRSGLK